MEHKGAVNRASHVQFDAVGTLRPSRKKRFNGVLTHVGVEATVGKNFCHRSSVADAKMTSPLLNEMVGTRRQVGTHFHRAAARHVLGEKVVLGCSPCCERLFIQDLAPGEGRIATVRDG